MGRAAFEPSDRQRALVRSLAGAQPLAAIAKALGINKRTLHKHFAAELGRATPAVSIPFEEDVRPRFVPAPEQRRDVERLAAAGTPEKDIATYLRLPAALVAEHFADELANGPTRFGAEITLSIAEMAVSGNVPSQKLWLMISPYVSTQLFARRPTDRDTPARLIPPGKKAEADAAARTAADGTPWADLLADQAAN